MLEQLQMIDTVDLRFSQDGLFILNITIAFIMFGVALGIKTKNFVDVFRKPGSVVVGFLSQFVLLPALTFLVVVAFRDYITPTVGLGMILVAACPGGNISNFMTSLSKGNAALSVSLTAIATMVAVVLTPLNFAVYGNWFTKILAADAASLVRPLEIDPVEMFKAVLILLGIPLILGMSFNYKFPLTTGKLIKPMQILSIMLFLGMVFILFRKNYDFFLQYIKFIFIIVLIHNSLAFLTGFSIATLTRRSKADRRAITIETGIQNSGLALVLLFNPKIFPADLELGGMAFIAAWWGIWHILSGLSLAGTLSFIPLREKTAV